MASCVICKKAVYSGLVICDHECLEGFGLNSLREELIEMHQGLVSFESTDGIENYTTGYRNGKIELLEHILGIFVEDAENEVERSL